MVKYNCYNRSKLNLANRVHQNSTIVDDAEILISGDNFWWWWSRWAVNRCWIAATNTQCWGGSREEVGACRPWLCRSTSRGLLSLRLSPFFTAFTLGLRWDGTTSSFLERSTSRGSLSLRLSPFFTAFTLGLRWDGTTSSFLERSTSRGSLSLRLSPFFTAFTLGLRWDGTTSSFLERSTSRGSLSFRLSPFFTAFTLGLRWDGTTSSFLESVSRCSSIKSDTDRYSRRFWSAPLLNSKRKPPADMSGS